MAEYDHVILIYAHLSDEQRAQIHRQALQTLKPGGTLILEAYTREQLDYDSGGPRDINMLYSQEMLETDFSLARIHQFETMIARLNEGKYHVGDAAIIRLIAQPQI